MWRGERADVRGEMREEVKNKLLTNRRDGLLIQTRAILERAAAQC